MKFRGFMKTHLVLPEKSKVPLIFLALLCVYRISGILIHGMHGDDIDIVFTRKCVYWNDKKRRRKKIFKSIKRWRWRLWCFAARITSRSAPIRVTTLFSKLLLYDDTGEVLFSLNGIYIVLPCDFAKTFWMKLRFINRRQRYSYDLWRISLESKE